MVAKVYILLCSRLVLLIGPLCALTVQVLKNFSRHSSNMSDFPSKILVAENKRNKFKLFRKAGHVSIFLFEPRCEKTGHRGVRPGPTQTGLYRHRRWLEA